MNSKVVLCLDVHRPIKTDNLYEFHYDLKGQPLTRVIASNSLKSTVKGILSLFQTKRKFGFRALNFLIKHNEIWDTFFPLMFLIRNGGPIFKTAYDKAIIRFRYPVNEMICDFFVRRAANFGLSIKIEANTYIRTYDIRQKGHVLAFGNGKESRLLLGLLREIGKSPRIKTGRVKNTPPDLPGAEVSEPLWGTHAERIMPAIMSGSAHCYYGSSLGEVFFTNPWQQYYDISSWQGQCELTELFYLLGIDMRLYAPVSVLPSNIIQNILLLRYPSLYEYQQSVKPQEPSEKNLHLSLIKIYHNMPIHTHCNEGLFRSLLCDFISAKLSHYSDFGFRNARKYFHLEMMAIIAKCKSHYLLNEVRELIPSGWSASWIDYIHSYVNPDIDPAILEIFRIYANEYTHLSDRLLIPG